MIVVVTGGGGFIGLSLARQLLADPRTTELWNFDIKPLKISDSRVHNALLDLRDAAALDAHRDVLQRTEYVFHLAGVTKRDTLRQFLEFNVNPTRLLLERVKGGAIRRFVYISSQSAASPAPRLGQPSTEKDPLRPVEAYGHSKKIGEVYVRNSEVPHVIIRPASVYGPHDPDYRNIFEMVAKGVHIYPSNLFKYYSAIYVEDLVDGIIRSAHHGESLNKTYFLAAHEEIRWKTVYNIIHALIGAKKKLIWNIPYWLVSAVALFGTINSVLTRTPVLVNRQKARLSKPHYWTCSSQAARADFGFSPRWSLEAGLTETHKQLVHLGYLK